MMAKRVMFNFKEHPEIIERAKAQARAEGTTISALMRRALRRELSSLPAVPTSEQCPKEERTS